MVGLVEALAEIERLGGGGEVRAAKALGAVLDAEEGAAGAGGGAFLQGHVHHVGFLQGEGGGGGSGVAALEAEGVGWGSSGGGGGGGFEGAGRLFGGGGGCRIVGR